MVDNKQIRITLAINDKITKPLREIQGKFDSFTAKKFGWASQLSNSLKGVAKYSGMNKVFNSVKGVGSALGDVGKEAASAGLKVGAIAGAGIVGMLALVKQTADYGDELINVAKRIDFGVEAFQEYRYAAEQSGVSNEDFTKGVDKFTRSIGEAKAGQGQLFNFLKQTNPALLKQVLAAKSNEEAFGLMVNSLGKVKDAQKQAMYASLLFGKSGKNFTNLANEGADGIQKMRDNAKALGLVMSEVEAKRGDDFGDTWSTVSQVFVGIRNTIAGALMPELQKLMDEFLNWVKENKTGIADFSKMLSEKVPGAIKMIRDEFDSLANGKIVKVLKWIGDTFGYVNVAIVALVTVLGGPLIMALAALLPVIYGLGVALLTTPIGWICLGLLGLAAILYGLYKAWMWVWKGIKAIGQDVFGWITDGIDSLLKKFAYLKKLLPSWLGGGDSKTDVNLSNTQRVISESAGQQKAASSTSQVIQNYVASRNPQKSESEIKVSFDNLPKGARVSTKGDSNILTDYSMGMLGDFGI